MGLFDKKKTKLSHLAAELIGTFILTKIVLLAIGGYLNGNGPIIGAATLMFLVYTIGPISGSHLNPAITIGLLSTKQIKPAQAAWYIISQMIGASLALLSVFLILGLPQLSADGVLWQLALGEFVGTFVLAWGVYSAITGKTTQSASGLTVGAGLFVGILISSPLSNGVLNPALAVATGSVSLVYLLVPILGSILAMQLSKHLEECKIKL